MQMFELTNGFFIVCNSESTRYGFRHVATLLKNGYEVFKTKICCYNRTWESFEFESVINQTIEGYFEGDKNIKIKGV